MMKFGLCLCCIISIVDAYCTIGYIMDASKSKCIQCPVNHKCDGIQEYPERCLPGTRSFAGSFQCCRQNSTCPMGYAINPSNECECTPMKCPMNRPSMVLRGEDVVCLLNPHCNNNCENHIQDESTCACSQNSECVHGKQYWVNAGEYKFECVLKSH